MPNALELCELCDPEHTVQEIYYESLWILYKPGSFVVTQHSKFSHSRASLIDEVQPPTRKTDRRGRSVYGVTKIICRELEYNGIEFSFRSVVKRIRSFKGPAEVSELMHIPLELLEWHKDKRHRLLARGKRFWDLRGQHLKEVRNDSRANRSMGVRLTLPHLPPPTSAF